MSSKISSITKSTYLDELEYDVVNDNLRVPTNHPTFDFELFRNHKAIAKNTCTKLFRVSRFLAGYY